MMPSHWEVNYERYTSLKGVKQGMRKRINQGWKVVTINSYMSPVAPEAGHWEMCYVVFYKKKAEGAYEDGNS